MSELKKLLVEEKELRHRVGKLIENGKKTGIPKRTQGFYETKIADLKKLWEEYSAAEFTVSKFLLETDEKHAYLEKDHYGDTEAAYSDYMSELVEGLRSYTQVKEAPSIPKSTNATTQPELMLPRIALPKYDGDYDMWRSFRDLFVSLVHDNPNLTPVQKLHHLKACLVGDAEKVLRHTPLTNKDYEPAWKRLRERYENQRILVNHQLKVLVNQTKQNTETVKGIKSLLDTTEECLQQLKSLEVDTSSWDAILIYLLVQKLPFMTLKYWEEEQGATQKLPTFTQFITFLNRRLKVLESIADKVVSKPTHSKPQVKASTQAFHTAKNSGCPVCNKSHFVVKCPKYQGMGIDTRLKVIKAAGCCLNCFAKNHSSHECNSKYTCFKCQQRHHTTLHKDSKKGQATTHFTTRKSSRLEDHPTQSTNHSSIYKGSRLEDYPTQSTHHTTNKGNRLEDYPTQSRNQFRANNSNRLEDHPTQSYAQLTANKGNRLEEHPTQSHSQATAHSGNHPMRIQSAHYADGLNNAQTFVSREHNQQRRHGVYSDDIQSGLQSADSAGGSNDTHTFVTCENYHALLSTALVIAQFEHEEPKTLRCLIDTGSQSSFITEEACNQLGAIRTPTSVAVSGISVSPAAISRQQTKLHLRSRGSNGILIKEEFLVLKEITDFLPRQPVSRKECQHLKGLELADPTFWKPGKVDALLGARVYAQIIQEGIRRGSDTSPVAINTTFGWILLGPMTRASNIKDTTCTVATTDTELSTVLKRFWEIEEVPKAKIFNQEEEECEQYYKATHTRLANGKYQVKIPFCNNAAPILGQSRPLAIKRFINLKRQFVKNPQLECEYKKCLNEYLELDHMEEVAPPKEGELHYYIPHHAVMKESTTTKLRVVFDASAKASNGKSMNDYQLKGPTLQPKLFATLLKWRKYKVAMNADIEKMYRMIEVHPEHRTFQRIIWQHPRTNEIQDYQLKTVTFGTSSAPYLAIKTLQQLAEDEKDNWPLAAKVTHTDFYVDDLLTGADNVEEAKELQEELIQMLKAGGFNLRKWASNEAKLLERLPMEHRELKGTLTFAEDESIKTLGIQWHPVSDYFTFTISPRPIQARTTKRTILSEVASLYDPLGWLAPILIVAKILMQTLWITGFSWDDQVSEFIKGQWENFKLDLSNIEMLKIPRWIHYSNDAHMELHGFCDASAKAYAAVLYIRVKNTNGIVTTTLLTSKTRVAPTKPTTIPRLELNGAVILARLIKTTVQDMQLQNIPIFAWTDSMIVLQWIKEHPSRWKTYVANRVVEIQDSLKYDRWQHIPTEHNPADLASRGTSAASLINSRLWWHGPSWLVHERNEWPNYKGIISQTDLEAKSSAITSFLINPEDDILLRYSSFTRLTKVVATIRRFMHNCKNPHTKIYESLSNIEWSQARATIFRAVQQTAFPEEYKCLLSNKPISSNSRLIKLNPFMDENNLIRIGGRLSNATITYTRKHPIILPHDHHVTLILIDKLHLETLHGGPSLVLSNSRDQYWILNARRCITSRIHKCITCARYRSATATQLMGDLPSSRVNIAKPFTKVGIDYAGPIITKVSTHRNAKRQKAYFCIFVCMVTKAVHLELVSDLTSEAFLAALRRFVARRGLCTDIYSDCGTNFIGGKAILDKELKQAIRESTPLAAQYLASRSISWHFNPPASPHFGGLWEAGVKSVKYHLRRVLGNAICTFEEYATILAQIEACLNSRPLCQVGNDPEESFILTPGHFLIGQSLQAIPESDSLNYKGSLSQRWKYTQQLSKQFWDKWCKDYLNQLQHRKKWYTKESNMEIGDIVLLKGEQIPPAKWPLGIIEKVYPGKDGLVRVVQVRTQSSVLQRPITKICRLPIEKSF